MSEETSNPQNWKLLLVAIVIGAVVALVYNWHIKNVREANKAKTADILVYKVNMEPGQKIDMTKVATITVSADFKEGLNEVVQFSDFTGVEGKTLSQRVLKDKFVMWGHFGQGPEQSGPPLPPDHVAKTISVDPNNVPSMMLRVGCRVNIVAKLPSVLPDGRTVMQSLPVIEGVRLIGIGNRPNETTASGGAVRSITIEVLPSVSREIDNVLAFRQGEPGLELISGETAERLTGNPAISNKVQHLKQGAIFGKTGGMSVVPGSNK